MLRRAYIDAIVRAGGVPLLLAQVAEQAREHLAICDAFVFTGGDDPRTEEFGVPTHPRASVMDPARQRHELTLLRLLREERPDIPVLGVCLGMQLMALVEGGALNQCLDDDTPTAGDHAPPRESPTTDRRHALRVLVEHPVVKPGEVNSWHRQAVRDAGAMRVVATAYDGVIEAIDDPRRAFCVGVQWHPERLRDVGLDQRDANGDGVFMALMNAARAMGSRQ